MDYSVYKYQAGQLVKPNRGERLSFPTFEAACEWSKKRLLAHPWKSDKLIGEFEQHVIVSYDGPYNSKLAGISFYDTLLKEVKVTNIIHIGNLTGIE